MNVAIVGSREFPNMKWVHRYVRSHLSQEDVLISGGARGVDRNAEYAALEKGLRVVSYRPVEVGGVFQIEKVTTEQGWEERDKEEEVYPSFGVCAMQRNLRIIWAAERVIAFFDGSSRGTAAAISMAKDARLPLEVCGPTGKVDRFVGEEKVLTGSDLRRKVEEVFGAPSGN